MKKVFSVNKFIKCCNKDGFNDDEILNNLKSWANECDGMTEKEMKTITHFKQDEWMVEVEEDDDNGRDDYEEMQIKRHDE